MTVSARAAARSVASQQKRAEDEVRALVEAGLAVLRRHGAAGLTVAEVLAEAGLSTRAFYRHFQSKDELVLAVFEQEAQRRYAGLEAQLATAASPRAALETWVDEMLALGFEPRRSRRTKVLAAEGARAQADFPEEFAAILAGAVAAARSGAAGPAEPGSGARRMVGLRGHVGARRAEAARRPDRSGRRACTRVAVLPAGPGPATVQTGRAVNLPPVDSEYYDTEYETMPRPQLLALQEELLLQMLPYAYEHAPLIRETWDAAGVHPRDITSLADFRAGAPFVEQGRAAPLPRRAQRSVRRTVRAPSERADGRDVDVGHHR